MKTIENEANYILNQYLKVCKTLELAKECSVLSVEKIMENCKQNKVPYWHGVKNELMNVRTNYFIDLRK